MGIIRAIKPELLEWFLNRTLKNFDHYKQLSDKEIDERLNALNPVPQFYLPMHRHQKIMFLIGAAETNFIYWADMGTGKSYCALSLIKFRHQDKPSLVLVPDVQNIQNWLDEVKKFTPELKAIPIIGTKKEKLEALNTEGDIYISHYIGLQAFLNTSQKKSISIDPEVVREFGKEFNTVIFDEMVGAKNSKSITFQICNNLSASIPYRYGLTGRPFGRMLIDLWAQFYIIDRGVTLGKNKSIFQQAFFTPKENFWGGVNWTPNEELKVNFHNLVKNKTIHYASAECQDLPKKVSVPIYISLSKEASKYYKTLKNELVLGIIDDDWRSKIKNTFVKLRQVCSGYLQVPEIEVIDGVEKVVSTEEISFDNPKELMLEQIISLIPESKKLIIFHDFTPSGRRIVDKLKELKVPHVWLWGGATDKIAVVNEFKTNPRCRVLVANLRSGAVGLNLQVANYMLFYENAITGIIRAQAEKRIHRGGQTETVYIYDFIVKDSVEEKILGFLQESEKLFQEIVEGKFDLEKFTKPLSFLDSIDKNDIRGW